MRIGFTGVGRDDGERAVFELYPVEAVSPSIELVEEGNVLDEALYELSLQLEPSSRLERAFVSVSGGTAEEYAVARERLAQDGSGRIEYVMRRVESWRGEDGRDAASGCASQYFRLVYGFARIEVELELEGATGSMLLSTRDIPCRSQNVHESACVERMLTQLLDVNDVAARWMFSRSREGSIGYSLIDGGVSGGSAQSFESMVGLIERALVEYGNQAGFFRNGARSRIVRQSRTVPLGAVRNAGRDELMWMAHNTGMLYECPDRQGVYYNGSWYLPRKVETSVRTKSFDGYENQRVLGFLSEIIRRITLLLGDIRAYARAVADIEHRLGGMTASGSVLPALAIIRVYASRGKRNVARLEACLNRARELRRSYGAFLPDVREAFGYTVRRTKIFTEVRPYYRLYALMQEWLAFGEFSPVRESLAFQAARLDKLYEYYVLYRMLNWLSARGFEPRESEERSIRCGAYASEGFFRAETGVATVYELAADFGGGSTDRVGVTLYYQPIIHASALEEEGIRLHRLSYRGGRFAQNYWTPDFLVEVIGPAGDRSYHVIDAKYRFAHDLSGDYPKKGELADCVMKYKQDVGGAAGECVESVWLVAGKWKHKTVYYAESSPWAMACSSRPRSGVAVLTSDVDKLDAVFAEVFKGVAADADLPGNADVLGDSGEGISSHEELCLVATEVEEPLAAERPAPNARAVVDEAAGATEMTVGSAAGEERERVAPTATEVERASDPDAASTGDRAVPADAEAQDPPSVPGAFESALPADLDSERGETAPADVHPKRRRTADAGEPKKPKPVKKANLPKAKPVKRRRNSASFALDDATRAAVDAVAAGIGDIELLYNVRWAQGEVGLSRQLLRRKRPEGREVKFYERAVVAGEDCWITNHWTPVQKNRLQSLVRQLEKSGGSVRPGDEVPPAGEGDRS